MSFQQLRCSLEAFQATKQAPDTNHQKSRHNSKIQSIINDREGIVTYLKLYETSVCNSHKKSFWAFTVSEFEKDNGNDLVKSEIDGNKWWTF